MKNSKRKLVVLLLSVALSLPAFATGGNGNEPESPDEGGFSFCALMPSVCDLFTNSGTGGNGNEPI